MHVSRHSSASLDDFGEISRASLMRVGIHPVWTSELMYKRRTKALADEVDAIRRGTDQHTLSLMIQRMESKGRAAHARLTEMKWKAMLKLRKGLKRAPANGSFNELYFALSNAEPNGIISESRLTSVFARVYGIDFGAATQATRVRTAPISLPASKQFKPMLKHRRESYWARLPRTGRRRDCKRMPPPLPGSYFRSLFHGLFAGFASLRDGAAMDYREFMCAFM